MDSVTAIPLAPSVKRKLIAAGFRTRRDVGSIRPVELAKAASLTPKQALEVSRACMRVGSVEPPPDGRHVDGVTASELLEMSNGKPIVSFCQSLDNLLGGGIQVGEITEFCGAPGVGKTQLGMQLAVDAQIPGHLGGVEGGAVYIDTEGSFHVSRIAHIATSLCRHIGEVATSRGMPCSLTMERILGNIHLYRCCSEAELLATVRLLPQFLKEHPDVKLIVLDSVAFHFRHDVTDMAVRTRTLATLAQALHELAYEHRLAVVIINQVTTRVSGESRLVPALGESWSHACTNRVMLHWRGSTRCAKLLKSTSRIMGTAQYDITPDGVRDVRKRTLAPDSPADEPDSDDVGALPPPAKAARRAESGAGATVGRAARGTSRVARGAGSGAGAGSGGPA